MKIKKSLVVTAFAASLLAGCASSPKEEPAGPSAEQVAAEKAISSAKAAIKTAKSNEWLWRDTGKIMKSAEEAFGKGDYAKAEKLAAQAEEQAHDAVNQYHLESAKDLRKMIGEYSLDGTAEAKAKAIDFAIANANGASAHDMAKSLLADLKASGIQYTVERGDSLWRISGKSTTYGNPYQWPLIYKQNAAKIKDADLIYPGQEFAISRNVSAGDVDAAVHHAKTRGAWSVGAVEASDRAYLGN
ncbi:MAG: LysM peptidoglycan-binding domain-containing protein [Gammaproteobacteria bacterium]